MLREKEKVYFFAKGPIIMLQSFFKNFHFFLQIATQAQFTPSDLMGIRRNPRYRIPTGSCRILESVEMTRILSERQKADIFRHPTGLDCRIVRPGKERNKGPGRTLRPS
jgi:hypothetical protein